jgi:hypothetical protein
MIVITLAQTSSLEQINKLVNNMNPESEKKRKSSTTQRLLPNTSAPSFDVDTKKSHRKKGGHSRNNSKVSVNTQLKPGTPRLSISEISTWSLDMKINYLVKQHEAIQSQSKSMQKVLQSVMKDIAALNVTTDPSALNSSRKGSMDSASTTLYHSKNGSSPVSGKCYLVCILSLLSVSLLPHSNIIYAVDTPQFQPMTVERSMEEAVAPSVDPCPRTMLWTSPPLIPPTPPPQPPVAYT